VATITWGAEFVSPATDLWTACLDQYGAAPVDPVTQPRDELVNTPATMESLLRGAGFASVRAWSDDIVAVIDLERLVSLRTRLGSPKIRLDSLDSAARAGCVAEARHRLQRLGADDFRATATVVYAVAS
jgi:hypothetical protein